MSDDDSNNRRLLALGNELLPLAEAWHKRRADPFGELDRQQLWTLCNKFAAFIGVDGPEPLLTAYEAELAAHNALLDEIEALATDESIDVKLLVALVKRKRPAR